MYNTSKSTNKRLVDMLMPNIFVPSTKKSKQFPILLQTSEKVISLNYLIIYFSGFDLLSKGWKKKKNCEKFFHIIFLL